MSKYVETHQDKADIALADSMGATHRLNITQSHYVYELNGWVIWEIWQGWQCAQVINDRYVDHTLYPTLKEALEWACED